MYLLYIYYTLRHTFTQTKNNYYHLYYCCWAVIGTESKLLLLLDLLLLSTKINDPVSGLVRR